MATTEQTTISRQAPFLEDYARKLFLDTAGITVSDTIGQPSVGANYGAEGIAQFMNPFTESVIDASQADIARQGQIAQNQINANAVGAGAFGGSRQAIANQELQRNVMDQQAKTGSQLRATGFESALQQARNLADTQIRERSLLGQLAGQQAGIGQLQQQLSQNDIASQLGIGSLQQGQAQALLDAARQGDLQQAYEPQQRLAQFSDILRGVPSSSQVSTSVTAPTPSLLSQIGGVAATGLGLAGQLGYRPFSNNQGVNSLTPNLGGSR